MELLEHVPDPSAIVAACAKLIKPNGAVFFSTLNRTLKAYLYAIIGAEYLLRLLPKGTHHYEKFIRPSELMHWSRDNNLQMHSLVGITYNPLTRLYNLENNVGVNYIAFCQKSIE
jgi:2-polyprenyl-6-hydroxyphenyl methylase/3-demethylubiquinone-9 3-methyltransferase